MFGVGVVRDGVSPVEVRLKVKTVTSWRRKRGLVGWRMIQIRKIVRSIRITKVRIPANTRRMSWRCSISWYSHSLIMVVEILYNGFVWFLCYVFGKG